MAFKDATGREWSIRLDIDTIRRVRAATGFDLAKLFTAERLAELQDPVLLVDVLFCILQPQLNAAGITDREFGQNMRGDAIEAATLDMIEATIDFLPQARRKTLRDLMGKAAEVQEATAAAIQALVDQLKPGDIGKLPKSSGTRSPTGPDI